MFAVLVHWWVKVLHADRKTFNVCLWTTAEPGARVARAWNRFKPPVVYYWPFRGGASVLVCSNCNCVSLLVSLWRFYFIYLSIYLYMGRVKRISSIPSWQILTAHAQPFRGARDLAFIVKVPLDSLLVWARSGGSGETARMRRLAWTFAARIGDKYQIRLTRPIYSPTSSLEYYVDICWEELTSWLSACPVWLYAVLIFGFLSYMVSGEGSGIRLYQFLIIAF